MGLSKHVSIMQAEEPAKGIECLNINIAKVLKVQGRNNFFCQLVLRHECPSPVPLFTSELGNVQESVIPPIAVFINV